MDFQTCFCVLVTYNPDHDRLTKALRSIALNTPHILVVDNASQQPASVHHLCRSVSDTIMFIGLETNLGIAGAQNKGIAEALVQGADSIWFSDQDSIYPFGYLHQLLQGLADAPEPVAAIGPIYIDEGRGQLQPLVRFDFFSSKHPPKSGLNHVAHVISSGMVVTTQALKQVGWMKQELFIDWVDMEWCWRAHNLHGLAILVHGDVCMSHILGDKHVKIFNHKIVLRSPVRHYYMIRNALYLSIWSRSLHLGQRLELFAKAWLWSAVFTYLARGERLQNLHYCTRGLRDGFLRIMGHISIK